MLSKILVPLDGSELATCVLPYVLAMTQALGSNVGLLRLLEGYDTPSGAVNPVDWQLHKIEAQAYMDALSASLGERVTQPYGSQVLEGPAAQGIIEYAQKHDFGLIALSSHGDGGLNGWNVSSVVQKVIDRARKSILLVRAYQPFSARIDERTASFRFRRILVPLDGSQRAESVLPVVTTLAQYHDAEVVLVHIVAKPEAIQRMPLTERDAAFLEQVVERNRFQAVQYFEELQSRLPMASRLQIEVGASVAAKLHNVVEQADTDLVVLSAHGHSCQRQWPYGSVAVSFIAYGTTPLLILQDLPSNEMPLSKAEQMAEVAQPWSQSWRGRIDAESMVVNAAV